MARITDLKEKMRLNVLLCPSLDVDASIYISFTVLLLSFSGVCGHDFRVVKMCWLRILLLIHYQSGTSAVKRRSCRAVHAHVVAQGLI